MTDLVGVNLIIIVTYDAERSGKGKSRHSISFYLTDLAIAESQLTDLVGVNLIIEITGAVPKKGIAT